MSHHLVSRRATLRSLAFSLGAAALPWAEMARAAHHAHLAAMAEAPATFTLFGAADAADVDALTSQIIPTDDAPGAHEAGVPWFIDRALQTFFAHWRPSFMEGLAGFQAACRSRFPDAPSFASLTSARQIEFLHTVDGTPFFDQTRALTLCGLLSNPVYGGNRGAIGWKLIGFEDQHVFEAPFGYYDRDYPGFKIEVVQKP